MKISNDLGRDSIGRLLLNLSIPAIIAQLINALYNIVDRMYIGHIEGAGAAALTGVGITFPIIILISAFSMLVGMGGAPHASIRMGQGDNDAAEKILGNCFILLVILSVVLTSFFMIFKRPLLMLFGASEATLPYADDYLTIYLAGTVFVQMALGMNAFINSQGFAKIGMMTVTIGAVLNIVLDPVFIFVFGMGVKGAAIATILSQAVSAVWVLSFLFGKRTVLKIRPVNFKLDHRVILPAISLGLSPFVMQATESLINIVLNSSLQKYGGDIAVGSMTIITSILQVIMMPLSGLGQGAQPIIGFNYGAKNFERVKKTFRLLLICSLSAAVFVWACVMLFPRVFISLFSNDPTLVEATVRAIRIFLSMIFMMGAQMACQQTFVALGQAKISLFLALLRKVILLIPLVYILSGPFGITGIFLSEPIADFTAATTTVCMFAYYAKHKLFKEKLPEQ